MQLFFIKSKRLRNKSSILFSGYIIRITQKHYAFHEKSTKAANAVTLCICGDF